MHTTESILGAFVHATGLHSVKVTPITPALPYVGAWVVSAVWDTHFEVYGNRVTTPTRMYCEVYARSNGCLDIENFEFRGRTLLTTASYFGLDPKMWVSTIQNQFVTGSAMAIVNYRNRTKQAIQE